jgi:CYTH domain-containing protein
MEIERKYLVDVEKWERISEPADASFIQQSYLSSDPDCIVRLRITDNHAYLTLKGKTEGLSRTEFEYPIPMIDGLEILKMADRPVIIKRRYRVRHKDYTWEVDVFLGDNEGLVMAEVELKNESEQPEWPDWVLSEVTGDPRYYNSSLAVNPMGTVK